jgi:hypothetical protein
MSGNPRKHKNLEINDLIGDAVKNAIARRECQDAEDDLLTLSDREAARIGGGLSFDIIAEPDDIIVAGFKPIDPSIEPTDPPIKPICPPIIIVGMIYPPEYPPLEEA